MTGMVAGGHKIKISNPDKVIFPGAGIDKEGLVSYYQRMSEYILPFLKDRPLVMHRYPGGIEEDDFYQKQEPEHFPSWIDTITVALKSKKGRQELVSCNSEATLLYIANQGCITPHVWLSTAKDLNRPDKMIFDLDPPEGRFDLVLEGAKDLKGLFDDIGMSCFVMTTGSEGLHVVLPLDGGSSFKDSRRFAKRVAELLAQRKPEKYTTQTRKKERQGRLFFDYLRNSYGQTAVAPYSLRAREGAPVAVPLDWEELGKKGLGPQSYHYKNIFRRLAAKDDPWTGLSDRRNSLSKASKKISSI